METIQKIEYHKSNIRDLDAIHIPLWLKLMLLLILFIYFMIPDIKKALEKAKKKKE